MQAFGFLPALFGVFAQRFDGGDRVSFRLRRQQRARIDGFAVEQDGIRAGQPLLIAELHAVKTQSAQGGQQGGGWRGVKDMLYAVYS